MFKKSAQRIYLDYASLTPIDPRVVAEMEKYSTDAYANPSSLYREGVAAKKALDDARMRAAAFIGAHPDEIIFTSGGTEANNLGIIGAVEALREQGVEYKDMHVVASVIEHSSVRECLNYLNSREVETTAIGVDQKGIINLNELRESIRPNTVIVSVMTVNNEMGSIQPIRDIAKVIRQARRVQGETGPFNFQSGVQYPLFHTDAAQAALFNELNVEKLGVDLMTLDGSKIYGPRGIGLLYRKRGIPIATLIHGGGQESGLRSGTEPLPQIAGFALALDLVTIERKKETARIGELRGLFIGKLQALGKGIMVHGGSDNQSPHIVNISIPRIDSELLLLRLDAAGIACSTKSSCLRDEDESYVLKAIGADSKTSLRFSFGRSTTADDIKKAIEVISALLST
jgi:cysteine desulfurase